ncbi:MAG: lipopolysaccharide heptosyltransferase II [Acidobacteria bacterium]|nr:lipopolysaccharide heptosyltransferase II [Acidobacteriota bacterium]
MRRLVILAPNWLGDAVMALPAVADLRRALPRAHLAAAARPGIAPLFRMVPEVDEVLTLDGRAHGGGLACGGFDTALLLPNSFRSALAAARARIPGRWGYRTDWRAMLLTRSVAPPSRVHQTEYYQRLVRELGFPSGSGVPAVRIPDAARAKGAGALAHAGWDGRAPLVALAPGAAYGGAKRWPPRHFGELAAALASDGIVAVLVGSAADRPTGAEVIAACREGGALLDLVGSTDLETLAGVFAHCRTLVTNDSGAMHLAAALGVPITAVFGPTRDRETRPAGAAHVVLTHEVWCRPCMRRECPVDHRCMTGVAAADVIAAARRVL